MSGIIVVALLVRMLPETNRLDRNAKPRSGARDGLVTLFLLLCLATGWTATAAAESVATRTPVAMANPAQLPTARVAGFENVLLNVMRHADGLGYDGRYAILDPEIRQAFDLNTMARIVSGVTWTGWSDAQRAQLDEAFARFVIATYARRFNGYGGEQFLTDAAIPLGNGMLIMTRIVPRDAPPIAINYLMRRRSDTDWRIVDVFLSGSISELATQRSEFSAILERAGYQGLLDALKAKAQPVPAP